jgi:cation diffusion facilitator CzcD-associated flavoprotein CzcO
MDIMAAGDMCDVLVVGGGISGLRAADLLSEQGCSVTVLGMREPDQASLLISYQCLLARQLYSIELLCYRGERSRGWSYKFDSSQSWRP